MAYVRRLSEEERRLPNLDLRVAVNPDRWEPTEPRERWEWGEREAAWRQMALFLATVLIPILVALISAYFSLRAGVH